MERRLLDICNLLALILGIVSFAYLLKNDYFLLHQITYLCIFLFAGIAIYEIFLLLSKNKNLSFIISIIIELFIIGSLLFRNLKYLF